MLVLDFFPTAVDRLDAGLDGVVVAGLFEHLADRFGEALLEFFLGACCLGYFGGYFGVFFGVGVAHHQFFEFGLDGVEAEAVRQGDVEVGGFAGDDEFLGLLHGVEGAHVVQTVAELEEDDVGVVAHGKQDLAVVFRLLAFRLLEEHDVLDFGHAVDDACHTVAEDHAQFVESDFGVLHHVVEQCADDGDGAEANLLDGDEGHREGVEDVGFATFAAGAGMGFVGNLESAQDISLFVGSERFQCPASGDEFFVFLLYLALFALFVNHIHGKVPRN